MEIYFKYSKDAYGESSTSEDIEEVKNAVIKIEENIFYAASPYESTIFQAKIIFDRLVELTKDIPQFYLILDGRNTGKIPSPSVKKYTKGRIKNLDNKLSEIVIISGKNVFVKLVFPFIKGIVFGNINSTIKYATDEAIDYLKGL